MFRLWVKLMKDNHLMKDTGHLQMTVQIQEHIRFSCVGRSLL